MADPNNMHDNPFLAAKMQDGDAPPAQQPAAAAPEWSAEQLAQLQQQQQQYLVQVAAQPGMNYEQFYMHQQQLAAQMGMSPEQFNAQQQAVAAQQGMSIEQLASYQLQVYQQQAAAQQAAAQGMTAEQFAAAQQQHAQAVGQQAGISAAQQASGADAVSSALSSSSGVQHVDGLEEDFEADLAASQKKGKQTFFIVLGSVAVVLIIIYAIFGSSGIFEKVEEETPETVEKTIGNPDWTEAPMISVEVRSDPPGAWVVLNGAVTDRKTPGSFDFIEGEANTVAVFMDGYIPNHQFIPVGVDIANGVDVTLELIPETPPEVINPPAPVDENGQPLLDESGQPLPAPPPDVSKNPWTELEIRPQNPEDHGATAWLDGKNIGPAPQKVQVLKGAVHHVMLKKEGKAPHSVIFRSLQPIYLVEVLLYDSSYIDRLTEVNVEPAPMTAMVQFDDSDLNPGRAALPFDKGKLVRVSVTASEEYEPWQYSVHTTQAGNFTLWPVLNRYKSGPALVHFTIPEGQYWYPCLKRPGKPVCWEDDPTKFKKVEAGKYTLAVWEQNEGHASNRRNATNQPEIEIEPGFYYEITFDFTTDEVVHTIAEPVEWVEPAEGEPLEAGIKGKRVPTKKSRRR